MKCTILHVDMDAFYASIEQRDKPPYRGKPVIVGADPRKGRGRGVVAACSYEARRLGIHSAMPIRRAFQLCPQGVYLRSDFRKYGEISNQIREIFSSFADHIEPLSIDEAFLDVSKEVSGEAEARELARRLKKRILTSCRLTASVGVGPNKLVAKIAAELHKPDGLLVVGPEAVQRFLDPLPISYLCGVGPKTEAKLWQWGIESMLQLRQREKGELVTQFGKLGEQLWLLVRGIDNRPVTGARERKSVSQERTFPESVFDLDFIKKTLGNLCQSASNRPYEVGQQGKTVTLKLRYSDFTTATRQSSFREPLAQGEDIFAVAERLLGTLRNPRRKVRLIGVCISSLEPTSAGSRPPRQVS